MSDPFSMRPPEPSVAEPPAAAPPPQAAESPRTAPEAPPAKLPRDFVTESEHPVLPVPFTAQIGDTKLTGTGLSITAAYVAIDGVLDGRWLNQKAVATLQFAFDGFTVLLYPEVIVAGARRDGEMTLQFLDPVGPHLPQLRHLINSHIAGDLVSLGGFLSYSGPTKPKAAKAAENRTALMRVRSFAVGFLSLCVLFAVTTALVRRAAQFYEVRPVFIERDGREMRATTAGQIAYLNAEAKQGEVVFSINSNAGDLLNFKLPCDCEVSVTDGIFEGATVLPVDLILSLFDSNFGVSAKTQISIEGLGRAVQGYQAYLDLQDGRSVPVRIKVTSATNAASLAGDPYVPVELVDEEKVLKAEDIGKSARLRLTSSWLKNWLSGSSEEK